MATHNITKDLLGLAHPIEKFTPDPSNARKHDEQSYNVIANSLRQFQQRKPIVAQEKDGQLIVRAGNGTLEAAKRLGWESIAAVIVNEDSVVATAYAVADNKTAEVSTWDEDVLRKTLSALMDEHVAIEDFGFTIDSVSPDYGHYNDDQQSSSEEKPLNPNKEFSADDFNNFTHQCPRCGFEFDSKSIENGTMESDGPEPSTED